MYIRDGDIRNVQILKNVHFLDDLYNGAGPCTFGLGSILGCWNAFLATFGEIVKMRRCHEADGRRLGFIEFNIASGLYLIRLT